MRFSTVCDYAGRPGVQFGVIKTGTKNIRILEVGRPRAESFVVPLGHIANRRPAGCIEGSAPVVIGSPEFEVLEDESAYMPQ